MLIALEVNFFFDSVCQARPTIVVGDPSDQPGYPGYLARKTRTEQRALVT